MIASLDEDAEPTETVSDEFVIDLFEHNQHIRKEEDKTSVQQSLRDISEGPKPSVGGDLSKTYIKPASGFVWSKTVGTSPLQPRQKSGVDLVKGSTYRVWRRGLQARVVESAPQTVQVDQGITSAPRYELCAPSSTNHILDWSDGKVIDFIPFPDDPSFHSRAYLKTKVKKWQDIDRKVADDSAYVDTANTLVTEHGMTDHAVKRRFKKLFNVSAYDQILSTSEDYLRRMASASRVLESDEIMCNLIHCMKPNCTHVQSRIRNRTKRIMPKRAYRPEVPAFSCETTCYLDSEHLDNEEPENWDADRLEILKQVIHIKPDSTSCELAEACGCSCLQAHLHRIELGDTFGSEQDSQGARPRTARQTTLGIVNIKQYRGLPFFEPCSHSGPCNGRTNCNCHDMKRRCERYCPCAPDCPRKLANGCPVGCECDTEGCPCFSEDRECDPEVCHRGAMKSVGVSCCTNARLQLERPVKTVVTIGSFGWGLFADEDVARGQYIGEYVGEYIRFRREDEESPIHDHVGRSYAFSITAKWSINSAFIGNDTRFMNHVSATQHPGCNVEAKSFIVSGDVKIAMFAKRRIKKGEELTLDYGPNFFN